MIIGLGPGNHPVTTTRPCCLSPGVPEGRPEKSLIFKPVSTTSKVRKNALKGTKKHQNLTLKTSESDFCEKLVFATPLTPNACVWNPGRPDSNPKIVKKKTWKQAWTKTPIFVQGCQKASKWDPEIDRKSIKIQAWTPRSPFLCFQVSLDRPMAPQGAKVEAPGLPNDRFWAPKVTVSVSKMIVICKKVSWKLTSRN